MFPDYTTLVLRCYEEKRVANMLSPKLIDPTPAQLKAECINVFSNRYDRNDQRALNNFFEALNRGDAGLTEIKKCDTDKFKPLKNFLNNKTQTTDNKNIELLAWLIDFDQRPYEYGKRYDVNGKLAGNDNSKIIRQADDIPNQSSTTGNKPLGFKINVVVAVITLIVLTGGFIYWKYFRSTSSFDTVGFMSDTGCMYWIKDHYELTACNEKHGDALLIALDTFVFRNLKKINYPDTITRNSIGKVWYIKTSGNYEYFTAPGSYPPDPKRKLKPLTEYIFKNHLEPVAK